MYNPQLRLRLLCVFLIFLSIPLSSQNELLGQWTVSCPIEKMSEFDGTVCDICPADYIKDKRELSISKFEMTFEKKTLILKTANDLKTTFYNWDETMRVLDFKYNDKKYQFKALVLRDSDILVLKEIEGGLVILQKKQG